MAHAKQVVQFTEHRLSDILPTANELNLPLDEALLQLLREAVAARREKSRLRPPER